MSYFAYVHCFFISPVYLWVNYPMVLQISLPFGNVWLWKLKHLKRIRLRNWRRLLACRLRLLAGVNLGIRKSLCRELKKSGLSLVVRLVTFALTFLAVWIDACLFFIIFTLAWLACCPFLLVRAFLFNVGLLCAFWRAWCIAQKEVLCRIALMRLSSI